MAAGFSFWPHLFQKAFAARSERVIRRTVVLYPTFQLFLLPILLIGFAGPWASSPRQSRRTRCCRISCSSWTSRRS